MSLSRVEKEAGYKAVQSPPTWASPILRRIGRGHPLLTMGEKGALASYEDGITVYMERRERGVLVHPPMTGEDAADWAERGWLIPIEGEALLEGGTPQRYRARTPADPPLPRIVNERGERVR